MILKTNSHRQEGLFVTSNIQPLNFINMEKFIVAQTFITNPLMYNNRKITARLYLLVKIYNNNIETYVYKDGLIYYSSNTNSDIASFYDSKNLYKENNPITINSYMKKTSFAKDIKTPMNKNMNYLIQLIKRNKKPFNSFNCFFELFGVDFQLTEDLKSYIIEVNSGPGMTSIHNDDNLLRRNLIKWYGEKMILV